MALIPNLVFSPELLVSRQLHYVQFLGGDGNFKLQRLAKRSASSPENKKSFLGDGGFWVPEELFNRYLNETSAAVDEPQGQKKSACNTMAGDPGYTPDGSKALDVTGVFCVSCRHIFICPNGVVDFHKGERYLFFIHAKLDFFLIFEISFATDTVMRISVLLVP